MACVSVIVPVYNTERYLSRCIESILDQSFTDFELVLVDDGSPDCCGTICDEYARKDKRVTVIHKPNGGVSSARNEGIEAARGRYVMFCDSDDEIPENALETMVEKMESCDAQMVVGGFEHVKIMNSSVNAMMQITKQVQREDRMICIGDFDAMLSFWTVNNMLSSCAKLYRLDIIREHNIQFDTKLVVLEDYAFVIDYLAYCEEITMISDIVYACIYRTERPLEERRSRLDFFDDVIAVSNKLAVYLQSIGCPNIDDFQKVSIYETIMSAYKYLWNASNGEQSKRRKFRRIKKAISEPEFQKMIQVNRGYYTRMEYRFLRRKWVYGLAFLRLIGRFKG